MNNQDDFNLNFERFASSIDPKEHKESIRRLLSQIKLEDEFNARLDEGSELIKIFFQSFKNAVKRTIANNRHTDYMQNLLKQYEEYKQFFLQVWTTDNPAEAIYAFRATYLKKDATFRNIAILGSQSFDGLAEEIIAAMGWENDHMHGFSFPPAEDDKNVSSYSPYTFFAPQWQEDQHPIFTSDQILICHLNYDRFPMLRFEFDFGDSHLFEVSLKKIRKAKRDETYKTLPKVIAQQGKAPKQYPNYS